MPRNDRPLEERKRLSPELRKDLIVDAASRVLAINPDWTVQDVADEAGVSDKLLYLYYPGGVLEQLADLVAERFVATIPSFMLGISLGVPTSKREIVERAELIISRALDWTDSLPGAWIFGPERDRLSSSVGKRWEQGQRSVAGLLAGAGFKGINDTPLVRSALNAELRAFEMLVYDMKLGTITRAECQSIAVDRFTSLFTKTLPALSG